MQGRNENKSLLDAQHESLAAALRLDVAYGRNAIRHQTDHGNALLSRFPIVEHENQDISDHRLEQRGLLHARIELDGRAVHCFVVHLGLFAGSRSRQILALTERIRRLVPEGDPILIAGDFNDWGDRLAPLFVQQLGLYEVFSHAPRSHGGELPRLRDSVKRLTNALRGVPNGISVMERTNQLGMDGSSRLLLPPPRAPSRRVPLVPAGPHLPARLRRAQRARAARPGMGPAVRSFPAAGRAGTAVKREPVRLDWTDGNDIRLLQNGADFFPSLCAAIDAATVSVHLETYIFMLDRSGEMVLRCLAEAARRQGASGAGRFRQRRHRRRGPRQAHQRRRPVPHLPARAALVRQADPSRSRLRRLHRKVSVIDGQIAYVGGINIVDDYDDLDPTDGLTAPRFDFAVKVRGPVVTDAAYAQDLLWVRLNWARLRRHPRDWNRMRLAKPHHVAVAPCGQMRAALVLRDNLRFRQTFERAYLLGITEARRDILIANAYFFPGVQFRRALARAAARGVRVRLLLQGKVEYRMQYHATRSLYDQLLRDGIEIYEYMPGYLHAKVAVIDNVATVGSSNLDPFSLLLAREANVVIDDQPFAWDLQERLETAIREGGRFIRPLDYQRRGLLRRWVDAASYALLRIGVALTGTSDKY